MGGQGGFPLQTSRLWPAEGPGHQVWSCSHAGPAREQTGPKGTFTHALMAQRWVGRGKGVTCPLALSVTHNGHWLSGPPGDSGCPLAAACLPCPTAGTSTGGLTASRLRTQPGRPVPPHGGGLWHGVTRWEHPTEARGAWWGQLGTSQRHTAHKNRPYLSVGEVRGHPDGLAAQAALLARGRGPVTPCATQRGGPWGSAEWAERACGVLVRQWQGACGGDCARWWVCRVSGGGRTSTHWSLPPPLESPQTSHRGPPLEIPPFRALLTWSPGPGGRMLTASMSLPPFRA